MYVTRADCEKPERSCKMCVVEYRRTPSQENWIGLLPSESSWTKERRKKWRVSILPNAHRDITRIHTTHTHTHTKRSKKETIDYSTK